MCIIQRQFFILSVLIIYLLTLAACGGSDNPSVSGNNLNDGTVAAEDLLQGAPQSLATKSIPEYYPDAALPSDFEVATADGLVKGLTINKSILVVKINSNSTTEDVNALFESIPVMVAGSPGMGLVYVELIGNFNQDDLVAAMTTLDASPLIDLVVEDVQIQTEEGGEIAELGDTSDVCGGSVPRQSQWTGTYFGGAEDRAWLMTEPSGNWWVEFTRMPAVWNFNDEIKRKALNVSLTPEELSPPIGVVDAGFQNHPDLPLINNAGLFADCHGNFVAGVIAAKHDKNAIAENGVGVEGIHPFARINDSIQSQILQLRLDALFDNSLPENIENQFITQVELIASVNKMLKDNPDIKVVNVSMGIDWKECITKTEPSERCIKPDDNDPVLRVLFSKYAQIAWDALKDQDALIVMAAGNSSDLVDIGYGPVDAKWSSGLNYLALEGTVDGDGNAVMADNIIVVEGVSWHDEGGRRYFASNTGGHIAAPAMCMTSTALDDGYASRTGTSFAAPIISGLAAYLWTLDPDLSAADVKAAILTSAWPMGPGVDTHMYAQACSSVSEPEKPAMLLSHPDEPDQPPLVDAFSAVMTLDGAVEMLVDVDDGTVDGVTVTGDDADTSLPGDGQIDMADFRAFRDAVAQLKLHELSRDLEQPGHIKCSFCYCFIS